MNQNDKIVETRIGKLTFDERGLPIGETSDALFDELDFQYGVQTYIWALPVVGTSGWRAANHFHGGTGETDMVAYGGYEGSMGILTPTSNVTYIFTFPSLAETGPLVWDIPPGGIAGSVMDYWQRAQGDFGLPGPDRGQGIKLLILCPDHKVPENTGGYRVIQLPTAYAFLGLRILNPDDVERLSSKLRLYLFEERDNPPASKIIFAKGKYYDLAQPHGFAYWERLNEVIQRETVAERDRFYMAMLQRLGMEKGKPFKPDARQRKLLEEAAYIGEKMAIANSFERYKRSEASRYRDDAHWKLLLEPEVPSQRAEYYEALEERASYTYEAIATSNGMISTTPGVGSGYVTGYKDADGEWLDGSKTYRLHVPADPPAKQFWSVTLYNTETRSFVQNDVQSAEVGSRTPGLVTNSDGTVDLYFGPKAPEGFESNWVQTKPGKGWFAIFRFYGPTEPYLERTWFLPDIEKAQ